MYRNVVYKINTDSDWSGNIVLSTWDDDGKPVTVEVPIKPSLMFEDVKGKYKSIFGTNLVRKEFDNIFQRKKFIESHPQLKFFNVDIPIREFLQNHYFRINTLDTFRQFPLRVQFIDIEIAIEDVFPDPTKAEFPINLITIYDSIHEKYFTWALGEVELDKEDLVLMTFDSEEALLNSFLDWFSKNYPDVLSGWNTLGFDVPYIINRGKIIVGEETMKKISPVGNFYHRMRPIKGRITSTYTIEGISHLDYMILYRDKFIFESRFNYKLDSIAEVELGINKLHYEGTFEEFYKKDFTLFTEYNIRDVEILKKLDDKLQLINLTRRICNIGLCEYEAIYSSIPYIYNALKIFQRKKEFLGFPIANENEETSYEGAYVQDPKIGKYTRGVAVVDVNSLYPSIMRCQNISPETKFGKILGEADNQIRVKTKTKEILIDKDKMPKLYETKFIKSSNNVLFLKHDIQEGIIPQFLTWLYDQRVTKAKPKIKKTKKLIEKLEQKYEDTQDESILTDIKKAKSKLNVYDMEDKSYKLFLNSMYGVMGTPFSPLFDIDLASAITLSGQHIIKKSGDFITSYFQKKYDFHEDVAIYGDTDSVAKDSIIRTSKGFFKIEDLYDLYAKTELIEYSSNGHEIITLPDELLVANLESKTDEFATYSKVKKLIRHKVTKKKWRIKTTNKEVIVTEDHSCMVLRDDELIAVKPKEILASDSVAILNDSCIEIVSLESIECVGEFKNEYVYDIEMEDDPHTFFANDILVHNSVFFNVEGLVNTLIGKDAKFTKKNVKKICDELDDFTDNHLNKFCFEHIVKEDFYSTIDAIGFEREKFASEAVLLAKKRYVLHLKNNGSACDEFYYTGVDIKKTELPPKIRDVLKYVIETSLIKNWTSLEYSKEIRKLWDQFKTYDIKDIAIYKGYNSAKEVLGFLQVESGTGIHAKAAIFHNHLLEHFKLLHKYPKIQLGDRLRYCYIKPNMFNINVIGFIDENYPEEFAAVFDIDHKTMFNKIVLKPLETFRKCSNWQEINPCDDIVGSVMDL